jgi:hypothetical protein
VGVVHKSKLFSFQCISVDLDLRFVLAQEFQQDSVVSFEVSVYFNGGFFGGVAKFGVVHVFATGRTEDLVGSSDNVFLTNLAFPAHRLH